ncbi:transglycosylase domain-containing protein [Bacillus pacificus]
MSLEVSDLKVVVRITQQVVKNYFLTMDKTAKRKVQEWYLSLQIRATILSNMKFRNVLK